MGMGWNAPTHIEGNKSTRKEDTRTCSEFESLTGDDRVAERKNLLPLSERNVGSYGDGGDSEAARASRQDAGEVRDRLYSHLHEILVPEHAHICVVGSHHKGAFCSAFGGLLRRRLVDFYTRRH